MLVGSPEGAGSLEGVGPPERVGSPEGAPAEGSGREGLLWWETDRERRLTAVIILC